MSTIEVATRNLSGPALDWAVAKCEDKNSALHDDGITRCIVIVAPSGLYKGRWRPSTDWSQGGPIIEREKFTLVFRDLGHASYWFSEAKEPYQENRYISGEGPAPLIAAMRCYVTSKLGGTVQLPKGMAP